MFSDCVPNVSVSSPIFFLKENFQKNKLGLYNMPSVLIMSIAAIFILITLVATIRSVDDGGKSGKEGPPPSDPLPPPESAVASTTTKTSLPQKKNADGKKVQSAKKTGQKNKQKQKNVYTSKENQTNYLTCGPGIQQCPPPKPKGVCQCNASKNLFTLFDGTM